MKVVITARNFSKPDTSALQMLRDADLEIIDYSDQNCGTGTSVHEMIRYIGDADIAITGLEPFSREVIDACPHIKMLSKRSIGYDSVDLAACKRAGITVARTTGAVEGAVAEHVLAYLLFFARNLSQPNADMHAGIWHRSMAFGVKNRTLGLVGFGGIGKEIAKRAVPFGMHVLYYCRHPKPEWKQEYHVTYCPFNELLAASDYVSVNVNLSDSTRGMFTSENFSAMNRTAAQNVLDHLNGHIQPIYQLV